MKREARRTGRRWVIILAGGEGERMRPLVTNWLGRHRPKQYCTFVGSRSMLQHTLDRAKQLVDPERIVSVIGQGHTVFLDGLRQSLTGKIIEQPANLDTLPGVFLPTTYVRAADPSATVIIFPSDHFIYPEDRFLQYAEQAALLAENLKDRLVLLAVPPNGPDAEYGWIEPGKDLNGLARHRAQTVVRFHEKPSQLDAKNFYRKGYLWNTMIVAVTVQTLWSLGLLCFPETMKQFKTLCQVLDLIRQRGVSKQHEEIALSHIYRNLKPANFSRGILERAPECSVVLKMEGITWSDWGCPDRVVQTLAGLGCNPSFAQVSGKEVFA